MSISFVRIDDRVIHGQLVTRWARELPCDGIVAIDDAVAADPLLSSVMKGAVQDTKVWLFDTATAIEKLPKVIASEALFRDWQIARHVKAPRRGRHQPAEQQWQNQRRPDERPQPSTTTIGLTSRSIQTKSPRLTG